MRHQSTTIRRWNWRQIKSPGNRRFYLICLLFQLQLHTIHITSCQSLSISNNNKNQQGNQNVNEIIESSSIHRANHQHQARELLDYGILTKTPSPASQTTSSVAQNHHSQQQQPYSTTSTLSPANQQQQYLKFENHQHQDLHQSLDTTSSSRSRSSLAGSLAGEFSSSNPMLSQDSVDDITPLATINNHRAGQSRAPTTPGGSVGEPVHQYVDVAGLVGRATNPNGANFSTIQVSHHQTSSAFGNHSTHHTNLNSHHHNQNQNNNNSTHSKSRNGLPECATQQVCNAIFVRMNYTQRLCECSANYRWKCSNTLDPQDGHTIELTRKFDKRIYTQIKTCEPLREVRACKSPSDWTLLALQSERSGKAHYVVVCKCPTYAQLEGPYTHNHPPYANIPGIRVYGMLCVHQTARSSAQTYATYNPALSIYPEFPWTEALNVANSTNLLTTLNY